MNRFETEMIVKNMNRQKEAKELIHKMFDHFATVHVNLKSPPRIDWSSPFDETERLEFFIEKEILDKRTGKKHPGWFNHSFSEPESKRMIFHTDLEGKRFVGYNVALMRQRLGIKNPPTKAFSLRGDKNISYCGWFIDVNDKNFRDILILAGI